MLYITFAEEIYNGFSPFIKILFNLTYPSRNHILSLKFSWMAVSVLYLYLVSILMLHRSTFSDVIGIEKLLCYFFLQYIVAGKCFEGL